MNPLLSNSSVLRSLTVFGGLAIGLLLAGCGKPNGAGGPPQGAASEVAVIIAQPERITIATELAGRASASLVAEIRPQVTGIIQKRLFEEGCDVKAGDILYQIDPAMYAAAHSGAKAVLAKTEATLKTIRAKADRFKDLVAIKAVSQQEFDDTDAALKQAEAELEVNKASLEAARINLAYTSIVAPISGRIGKSSVTIGALVTANQGVALAVIQQLDPVYVDVPQSSASLLRMKRNMANGNLQRDSANYDKVTLLLEDGAKYPQEGVLKFSDVTVDPSTGSFILRMTFPNPDGVLLPGMFVRAVVQEGINERAILIPQQAVSRDPKGNPMALIVNGEGKVEQKPLVLERAIVDRWLVASGLHAGDQVIVEGVLRVRPGATVKTVPFGKAGTEPGKNPENIPQSAGKTK